MLANYLRITLRNLKRQKGFSFINIVGLSTGLAASVVMLLFVQNEMGFDRHLEHGDDLYRVLLSADIMGQSITTTSTPAPMAGALTDEYPEVVRATRLDKYASVLVQYEDQRNYEQGFFLADSTVFDMFSIPLIKGDPSEALNRPGTVVVSEAVASKYFGSENPIGQVLRLDNTTDYEVTGVMRLQTARTHFRPEMIGSMLTSERANSEIWLNNSWLTYIQLTSGSAASALEAKFDDLVLKYVAPQIEQVMGQTFAEAKEAGIRYQFQLEPVPNIYLHSTAGDQVGPTGEMRYVYIMIAIALFVLVIACINFMNLSTARASNRAREVGLRKVLGSERSQLIRQFLGESLVMSVIAMIGAVALVYLVLPVFNSTAGTSLKPELSTFGLLVGISVITGLLAGLYPAFVLSGFRPVAVLKGSFGSSSRGIALRRTLVVFQFAISICLLVGTGVVVKQLRFIQNQDLGFDQDQVLVLPIESDEARNGFETFREEIVQHPAIIQVAAAGGLPGPNHIHNSTVFRGNSGKPDDVFLAGLAEVSHEYVETLGIQIIAGRDFSRDHPADADGFLINEAAAREVGLAPEELIGALLEQVGGEDDDSARMGTIVGVFRDAHFSSLHEVIQPLVLGMRQDPRYIPVRFEAGRTAEALSFLREKWSSYEPAYPFQYYFLDEDYQQFYEQEQRLGQIYAYFSGLAILIACLGLFGLASFVTSQRTKEIGVRKVLGASIPSIVYLLSVEFTRLVLIACVVAFPVAWYAMKSWLQDFAYATEMGWFVFFAAAVLAVVIAWITVSYQSIRAAVANPVDSLHSE